MRIKRSGDVKQRRHGVRGRAQSELGSYLLPALRVWFGPPVIQASCETAISHGLSDYFKSLVLE